MTTASGTGWQYLTQRAHQLTMIAAAQQKSHAVIRLISDEMGIRDLQQ
jgi:hypothetical protein